MNAIFLLAFSIWVTPISLWTLFKVFSGFSFRSTFLECFAGQYFCLFISLFNKKFIFPFFKYKFIITVSITPFVNIIIDTLYNTWVIFCPWNVISSISWILNESTCQFIGYYDPQDTSYLCWWSLSVKS